MPFNLNIEGYGMATFNTAAERDLFAALKDIFLATGGVSPHTNMDSVVREPNLYISNTFDNPLLNAGMDHIGIPRVTLKAYTTPQWNLMFPQGTTPTLNIKNRVIDKYAPHFDQDNYYSQLNSPNCSIPCEIYIVNANRVYVWDYTPVPPHLTAVLPQNGASAIATFGNGKWYIFVEDGGNYVIQEWTRDPGTCDSTLTRTINNPGVPGFTTGTYGHSVCASARTSTIIRK